MLSRSRWLVVALAALLCAACDPSNLPIPQMPPAPAPAPDRVPEPTPEVTLAPAPEMTVAPSPSSVVVPRPTLPAPAPTSAPTTTPPTTGPTTPPPGGEPEVVAGVVQQLDWSAPFDLGPVSETEIRTHGGFQWATKGFGNGYDNRHLIEIVDGVGDLDGRWARFINPGGLDAHTFSKAIRAVNPSGSLPDPQDDLWIRFEFTFDENWATQDQGKLGYSWTNANGAPNPGTNPTEQFEFMFHYFSPNHRKTSALWPSTNPVGPFALGDMVIGLDVYAADDRIGTRFSEPVFFVEEAGVDNRQLLFVEGVHYVLWVHLALNTPSADGPYDGVLEGWYSDDGGQSYTRGVHIEDLNWRGASTVPFQTNGLVRFNGGSGIGFEPGGAPDRNTGTLLPVQDYWYYVGEIRTQTENPLPGTFR